MSEERSRVVESLEIAARLLEAAATGPDVRAALRDGLSGLEYHSDTLARELAKDPAATGAFEPALRGRAERVQTNLHALLVSAWELLTLTDDELATTPRRATLVKALRAADTAEIALVFDQLLAPEGID